MARKVLNKAHQEAIIHDKLKDYVAGRGIQWTLIVELAPWMGGFYERLVGITKRVLWKILGVSCLTLSQLTTILTEVEVVVNSRPLVYVGDDIDSSHVLVPNNFLSMNSNNVIYDHCSEEKDKIYQSNITMSNAEKVLKVWKQGQQKLKQFWKLWRSEYLLNLRERAQNLMSLKGPTKQAHNSPQVGDVVLIKEDLPQGRWKVGVIHELVRGKDQMVRSARVLISPNKCLHRALSLLYPIECPETKSMRSDHNGTEKRSTPASYNNENDDVNTPGNNDEVDIQEGDAEHTNGDDSKVVTGNVGGRTVQQASLMAKNKMKAWLNPTNNFVCVRSVTITIANDII